MARSTAQLFLLICPRLSTQQITNRLYKSGLSKHAVGWFSNYLSGRSQSVQVAASSSAFLPVPKGVPQGSIFRPLLFLYINNLCENVSNASLYFYPDDTVIYCLLSSLAQTLQFLQSAFDVVQLNSSKFKLMLNADKLKLYCFPIAKN